MTHEVKLNDKNVTFIGAGNMAEALVKGLVQSGLCPPAHLTVTDISPEQLSCFRETYGVQTASDNPVAVAAAHVVVLAVKPQVMPTVLDELAQALPAEALVVSVAAGIKTEWFEFRLAAGARVVRVMPNTPALVGAGAAAICAGTHATGADLDLVESLMRAVGLVVRVDEAEMDAVTALSGSGPAYVFHLVEAMLDAAEEMGLPRATARALAYQTLEGAAQLLKASDATPADLRERVTSKGGTTAAALKVMADADFHQTVVRALKAARDRSLELSG